MKKIILLTIVAYLQLSSAFMTIDEFENSGLLKCYDTNGQSFRRPDQPAVNGQVLPLPNSIETFISIVERYESLSPKEQVRDTLGKFLKSFRIDDLHLRINADVELRDDVASLHHKIKRLISQVPAEIRYEFKEDEFTDDEKCALHFMLSHTINDTKVDANDVVVPDTTKLKQPRENGVVSLFSKRKHAFALGRVLLGIYAALLPSNTEDVTTILLRDKTDAKGLTGTKINVVYAVTFGDLIVRLSKEEVIKILPTGEWSDVSCPTEYRLDDNNGGYVSYSELLGAVDGLIIGTKIQENRLEFGKYKLSQILRQYYGYFGLVDSARTRWCNRDTNFQNVPDFENEMFNFFRLHKAMSDKGTVGPTTQQKIQSLKTEITNNIFRDIDTTECSISEQSLDRKFVSPRNIFAILDYSPSGISKLEFQAELIGNLSGDFDQRPRGNLMGVYSNLKPLQQNTLDVIVKNTGISGCPSCFAKYYTKAGNKEDEVELFNDLNDTLTDFDLEEAKLQESYQSDVKEASPGKIILYFNFGNPTPERRLYDSLWEIKRHYRGATILAIGDKKESLHAFVDNDQTDIYTSSPKMIYDIKQRINKIPGEFTFRACNQSSVTKEADNKQLAFIPPNKIQYWAMYPQYFLKSFSITMKFRALEGANIRVCYSRSYSRILEGGSGSDPDCQDSSGGEIEFKTSNPCHKRNVFDCNPFYFSVEGKKQPTTPCLSLRCSTPNDIPFEFEHQGISCNVGSYISLSTVALLFAALTFYIQRQ